MLMVRKNEPVVFNAEEIIEGACSQWPREGQFFNEDGSRGIEGAACPWPRKGNLQRVRSAIEGITGVQSAPEVAPLKYYMVVCRPNHEFDTVDSFRRQETAAYYPSFEELRSTKRTFNGQPIRRLLRVGIVSGYVFTPVTGSQDMTLLLQRIVGAIELVKAQSGHPLLLDAEDIETLRRIEAGRNTPKPEVSTDHNFKLGEKVRFKDDLRHRWPPGRIIKLARNGRISVEIALMGRKVEVKALPHQIERT